MIRDHIVFTCQDVRLKERLLGEADLTLAKAITLYRAAEATREQIKKLNGADQPIQSTPTSNVSAVQNGISQNTPTASLLHPHHLFTTEQPEPVATVAIRTHLANIVR